MVEELRYHMAHRIPDGGDRGAIGETNRWTDDRGLDEYREHPSLFSVIALGTLLGTLVVETQRL